MTELQQTKNSFKFIGKVTRIDKDGAFKEEESTKGKNQGRLYRSLRFGVKTSPNNEMTVQMFSFQPEEVFLWNSDKAKKAKENHKEYKGERIPFEQWVEEEESLREEGYAVLQSRIGLVYDENGKLKSKGLPSYVASKEIFDQLNNNDNVIVEGSIGYSKYENQQGKVVQQKNFNIEKVYRLKDIDFEDEKFKEITYFEQEIVYVDAELDQDNKKVYVTGRTIDYYKDWHDIQFVIDYSDGKDGIDEGMQKLAKSFLKRIKFGDLLHIFGDALNRVDVEEVEDDGGEEEDFTAILGGKAKPSHAQGYVVRNYIQEMRILGVESWEKKVYKEEDFIKDELIENEDDNLQDELGGKKKEKSNNPFDTDDDPFANGGTIEISDDDLPF
ncbi:hypothetical protein FKN04_12840 [Bacillus glycinifermentans]|uniref:hypothetical protein n=1 Tax=Bacillus glycinifermentans TaxID=1664069 RepID=UPI001581C183|nr:hypothetical protein [Bacillus glycinifermentans]NUJ17462.1 hypothetical protein [Bacillus glycinifermentans]